ncbi:hypothetical protein O9929_21170 [Vibrio lentus]|nr:hypothetical protein [Vibrio lentus]
MAPIRQRPYKAHTFTMGRSSNESADIRYQWDPALDTSQAKRSGGTGAGLLKPVYRACSTQLEGSFAPFHSYVSGDFNAGISVCRHH